MREINMRKWLIGISLSVHVGLVFGLFVAGLWSLERLEPAKHHINLGAQIDIPAAAATGGPERKAPEFNKKKPHPKEPVQPTEKIKEPDTSTTAAVEPGTGEGSGGGSGSGSGEPTDTGPCVIDCGQGSGQVVEKVVVVEKKPKVVPPVILRQLRISGETQIQPPDVVKTQIMRDGGAKLVGSFKVCLDATGLVSSISLITPTGYAGYDSELSRAMREWRYRPYTADGQAIAVCGIVTFNYTMK